MAFPPEQAMPEATRSAQALPIRPDGRGRSRRRSLAPLLLAAALLHLAVLAQAGDGSTDGPVPAEAVAVPGGLVSGVRLPAAPGRPAVTAYKGIPYAAPPVGDRRWRPPQPPLPWDGVRACTDFGASCPQPPSSLLGVTGPQDEDCLYLNVWTPDAAPDARLPVMVWIHGGAFVVGSGSSPHFSGAALAAKGVVVVTINYRLGPFGFLAHPLLSRESPHGVSGNYGMLDQIAALEWVRDAIAGFGGDPGCVTIFGESAGSTSVCRLLVSPLAAGLFHRAIAQSGGAQGDSRPLRAGLGQGGADPMELIGERVAAALGSDRAEDPLADLRARSAGDLLAAARPTLGLFGDGTRFGPVTDGWLLPDDADALWRDGRQHPVPLLAGTNADEGTLFLRYIPVTRLVVYQLAIRQLFGIHANEILAAYGASNDAEVPGRISALITDAQFILPARTLVRAMASRGQPAWLYQFTRVSPLTRAAGLGATHAAEIPYVFIATRTAQDGYEQIDHDLADAMSDCWTRFAATGDPNPPAGGPGDGVRWPDYRDDEQHIEFGDRIDVAGSLRREACDLIERLWTKMGRAGFDF